MSHLISSFFSQYAHQPLLVYGAVCLFMVLSAFGLPLPEEIILVSSGLIAYMSRDPLHFPPPLPDSPQVDVSILATVAFFAVIGSDYLIFSIGQFLGPRLFRLGWFSRHVRPERFKSVQRWMWKYGYWAVFVFRFTPGVRFPGHLTCGAMKLSRWKFLLVDAIAAGISVPTQIFLVAYYGQPILHYFGRFRLICLGLAAAALLIVLLNKFSQAKRSVAQQSNNTPLNPTG